ncbi:MAG: ribonuclease J, partial [Vulcanimicrobiaceae bacterium]
IGDAVLRDRRHLSSDGIMMVVVTIDAEEAKIIGEPDLISRGVFYIPDSNGVMDELKTELRGILARCSTEGIRDVHNVKENIRDGLSRAIYTRSKRRPIVVPVVMEV